MTDPREPSVPTVRKCCAGVGSHSEPVDDPAMPATADNETARSSRRRQPDRAAGDSSNECAGQARSTILEMKWWSMEAQPGLEPEQERTGLKSIHTQALP
eukprot:5305042-Pleurochrysis_carterae.AAC.1